MLSNAGIVIIGRNEGQNLRDSIRAAMGKTAAVVYVDSGSTDGSAKLATEIGAETVVLKNDLPFTAARARNEGFQRILSIVPHVQFVQFVDGDCELAEGWIAAAADELSRDSKLAAVCGRRRERFAERSVYNRMMDIEWNGPAGTIRSVGGDAMFRAAAFSAMGGFDPTLIAGEEPELCLRLRQSGWSLLRIDREMTRHDAQMLRFGQWWRRQVRSGYGAMNVAAKAHGHERPFAGMIRSARIWTIGWTAGMAAGPVVGMMAGSRGLGWVISAGVFVAAFGQAWRIGIRTMKLPASNPHPNPPPEYRERGEDSARRGYSVGTCVAYGFLTMLAKWGMLVGQWKYLSDRAAKKTGRIIEYKTAATEGRA